jgi:hypothetical protein
VSVRVQLAQYVIPARPVSFSKYALELPVETTRSSLGFLISGADYSGRET